jgi:hypothetical protein
MSCFGLEMIKDLLIWLVIVCAILSILKVLFPWVLSAAGVAVPGPLLQIINIFVWAVIAIFAIIIVFMLISCLLSMGGGLHLPLPRY